MALPTETCLLTYSHTTPEGFLLSAHCKTYIRLLLSCTQIYDEMTTEAIRLAPPILHAIQDTTNVTPSKLRPLQPTSFASLMHVTVRIPRWAIMVPLLELHLARLNIGIEDLQSEDHVFQMVRALNPLQIQRWRNKVEEMTGAFLPPEYTTTEDHYRIRTTYVNTVEFAIAINCLVAPGLCNGKRHADSVWCLRRLSL
jgi:hypothetical protein